MTSMEDSSVETDQKIEIGSHDQKRSDRVASCKRNDVRLDYLALYICFLEET